MKVHYRIEWDDTPDDWFEKRIRTSIENNQLDEQLEDAAWGAEQIIHWHFGVDDIDAEVSIVEY